jgi:DnaJ-class molecular chaperone
MADQTTPDNRDEGEHIQCPPCRGTGRIVSRLGGSASTITCPWCGGTGRFIPGHDAQAARRGREGEGPDDEPPAAA